MSFRLPWVHLNNGLITVDHALCRWPFRPGGFCLKCGQVWFRVFLPAENLCPAYAGRALLSSKGPVITSVSVDTRSWRDDALVDIQHPDATYADGIKLRRGRQTSPGAPHEQLADEFLGGAMGIQNLCPVCGYGMKEAPADFNICPSCGTEFGVHDVNSSIPELRKAWSKTEDSPAGRTE